MPNLRPFAELFEMAAARKGGPAAFEATLETPAPQADLLALGDDRWLSAMTKRVFQAGFNWQVIENKWPRFEEVFDGFRIGTMAMMSDEDLDRYLKTDGIVRHATKILSIRDNAIFLSDLAKEYGSARTAFATWPADDFVGLLTLMKKRGSRLGGTTGQYFLRGMGVDGFILSRDVGRALIREGVVERAPSSQRDLAAVQAAFNHWRAESGRPMSHISRTLSCSIE